jgi:hypothetical protein
LLFLTRAEADARSWIGLNDALTEGVLVWTTSEPVGYKNLSPNNNNANIDYGIMREDGTWNLAGNGATSNPVSSYRVEYECAAGLGFGPMSCIGLLLCQDLI